MICLRQCLIRLVCLGILLTGSGLVSAPALFAQSESPQPADTAKQAFELIQEIHKLQQEIEQQKQTEETVERQNRILRLWDQLQQTSSQPPPDQPPMPQPNPSTQPMPQPENSPTDEKPEGEPQPQPGSEQERRKETSDKPVDRSTEQSNLRNPAETTLLQAEERAELMRNVWGNLPEQVRERLANSANEKYLPQYEERIRTYFRALSLEKPPR